jgi:hypothetical protein
MRYHFFSKKKIREIIFFPPSTKNMEDLYDDLIHETELEETYGRKTILAQKMEKREADRQAFEEGLERTAAVGSKK